MEDISLYNMIKYIQNGTNLHIGVLFFGSFGNKMCDLPQKHHNHSSPICNDLKAQSKRSFGRCFRCRNLALQKALSDKKPFGGLCINGIYEYTHPVVIGNEVACVIFIGNILHEDGYSKLAVKTAHDPSLMNTLETKLGYNDVVTIGRLLENHILFLLERFPNGNTDTESLIENIKNYVCSNLEFDIDTGHIAAQFHYNKTYLGRLFKKETGMSLREYINDQRLEKAKQMLKNTDDSVITIAEKTGFNNVTYFNRIFKSSTGTTPSGYRSSK